LILDRPTVLSVLADDWLRHFPPDDKAGAAAVALGEESLRDMRQGSTYLRLGPLLPKLATAGGNEARAIAALYRDACDNVLAKRRELLCELCAPGTGGVGRDGNSYSDPFPGDLTGWGCRGKTPWGKLCGPLALRRVWEHGWEVAKKLVGEEAVILGLPRAKARHLFAFEDKRAKRPRSARPSAVARAET